MASAAGSQHRCVFVGNIPYDATEEQLVQICEEVGPVVSFRLVIDRETGKPKGYGFCEYKDEETALSARRNLQGYEINGRPLRVDFAENDKGIDRNREHGRGGPGLTSNNDAQKSLPAPPLILWDSNLHQPVGLPLAATAASVMARALSGAQSTSLPPPIQNGLQSLSGLGNDPLTHYLAKMSRYQLNEIMSEMKALATQNKPLARQLLQGSSQLLKALFQAQIMLGLVNPQMMQMASNQQPSSLVSQPSLHDRLQDQKPILPSHFGQMPSQKEAMVAMFSRPSENQVSNVLPNSMIPHQYAQPQFQNPSLARAMTPGTSGVPVIPPLQPQSLGGLSFQLQTPPLPISKGLISQIQPPLLQHPRPTGVANTSRPPLVPPSTTLQKPVLPHAPTSQARVFQIGTAGDMSELISHPSKRQRLEDASAPQVIKSVSGQSVPTGSLSGSQTDGMQHSEKQMPQLPPEVESALLQQVMSLTPEQLSSLPPDQQQQVLQLQQMLQ